MEHVKYDRISSDGDQAQLIVQWKGLRNTKDKCAGKPFSMAGLSNASCQIDGNLGQGFLAVLEATNDGVKYYPLSNSQGVPIYLRKAGIYEVTGLSVRSVRPRVLKGTQETDVNITICAGRV